MNFFQLISSLAQQTPSDIRHFLPELILCAVIVLTLLLRMLPVTRRFGSFGVMLIGSAVALYFAWTSYVAAEPRLEIFGGLLVADRFTAALKVLLLLFAVLFAILTRLSGIPDRDAATDFFSLVLGATLGMCLMCGANHLLMVFLGVEMASVPSYVLAAALKGRRRSSEAAMKYAVYGAGTAGVMLYGISLLAGVLGSVHLPTMAGQLALLMGPEGSLLAMGSGKLAVLALGALMVMVGLAFKLSAVPFHFWCPDVFEGASAEVNAFLSVASKAAALALLVRVSIGFGVLPPLVEPVPATAQQAATETTEIDVRAQSPPATPSNDPAMHEEANRALEPARGFIAKLLALVAVITCTFGNLAAYGQTNIKRLLAYSTIAHAGYMIMPVAAAVALAGNQPQGATDAIAALVFYITAYLFTNLGAFAIVAFLRNTLGSEEIRDYAGLIHRMPIVTICFALLLVSLIGIPPLAGFSGKYLIFGSLWESRLIAVLLIAGLNTAISLVYYARVIRTMTFLTPAPEALPAEFPFASGVFVVLLTAPVLILGVAFDPAVEWARTVSKCLFW